MSDKQPVGRSLVVSNGDGNGNSNGAAARFGLVIGAISVAGLLIGALVTFFVQAGTLNGQVTALSARMASMETFTGLMADRVSEIRANVAVQQADLREVETQFCASDIIRNLMHAQDLRTVAMLWKKAFPDAALATDNAYYPEICNRATNAGVGTKR